jgi:hypothetical protein
MKYKIIILLSILLTGGISASPNKSCKGVRCSTNEKKEAPVRAVMMMIDETEWMPIHPFLRNF